MHLTKAQGYSALAQANLALTAGLYNGRPIGSVNISGQLFIDREL
jgi:hypothetical protein